MKKKKEYKTPYEFGDNSYIHQIINHIYNHVYVLFILFLTLNFKIQKIIRKCGIAIESKKMFEFNLKRN